MHQPFQRLYPLFSQIRQVLQRRVPLEHLQQGEVHPEFDLGLFEDLGPQFAEGGDDYFVWVEHGRCYRVRNSMEVCKYVIYPYTPSGVFFRALETEFSAEFIASRSDSS